MKTLLKVSIHSFVDLITNSSSELFVCSTDKTIEVVKKIIEGLFDNYIENIMDPEYRKIDKDTLWTEVFKEPEVADYTFNWYSIPDELTDEYVNYNYDNFGYNSRFGLGTWELRTAYETTPEYKRLHKRALETEKKIRQAFGGGHGEDNTNLYETNRESYDLMHTTIREAEKKIWKKWSIKKSKSEIALIKYSLEQNGVQPEDIPVFPESDDRYGRYNVPETASERVKYLIDKINSCLSCGINIKAGDIILNSVDDNTVPYELFGAIESMLNAERRHLG